MLPQIIYLSLTLISFGYACAKHNQEKKYKKHDAYSSLVASLIMIGLLWWGGFFDVFAI